MKFFYFDRDERPGKPAGVTVSKHPTLPDGDFRITEYKWPRAFGYPRYAALWFVEADRFTADERECAFRESEGEL